MKYKFFLRLLGPILFFLIVYFYVDLSEIKNILVKLEWQFFCLSLLFVPPLLLVRSIRWCTILKKFGIEYSLWKSFQIYFVEMVAIMVVAVFGTFIKIFYLKNDGHGLLKPCLSIIADKYFDYLLPLIFGITSMFLISIEITDNRSLILLSLITLLFYLPARFFISIFLHRMIPDRIQKIFTEKKWDITSHFAEIMASLNFRTYVESIIGFAIYFLSIYFINKGVQIDLNYSQVIIIMSIISLITLIPISFLGIGTRDVGLLVVFNWFDRTPEQAVVFSIALLTLRLAIVMMGAIFWFLNPPPFQKLSNS